MNSLTPPFSGLTPDALLDALESVGLHPSGSLLALNSYENRVYQVGIDDAPPVVVKFYRPQRWSDAQILEEHLFVSELIEREIPVVGAIPIGGKTLHHHGGFRFAVFERRGGRTPELDRSETLEWMGRFLGRIHAQGKTRSYVLRPQLNIDSFGEQSLQYLLAHALIPAELLQVYAGVARQALDGVRRCFERAGEIAQLRLHGDCHAGNVLWTEDGPHFVDFDDSRSGPAVQDLWMMLSGERDEQIRQLADLLAGYEDFCDFEPRELYLIEALRTLRLLHYSAWLAQRWHDPAFPAAFPWFGSLIYWQDRILELREQIALMDEPPLWPV
jgi:Ser/Thr protein kinase RdoA (MazF antagonist)